MWQAHHRFASIAIAISRHSRRSLPAICIPLVLFACSNGAPKEEPTPFDARELPELAQVMSQLTPFEEEILADGQVSAVEYERAVFATMECFDELGVAHTEPELVTTGPFPQWHYQTSGADLEELERSLAQCENSLLRNIATVWSLQHEESEEVRERRRQNMLNCLREAGFDAPDYDTWTRTIEPSLPEARRGEALQCRLEAFNSPPPE